MASGDDNKIVLIGDLDVGKTSIFTRLKTGRFSDNVEPQTRKEADCKTSIMVNGKEVMLTLYDTAGMERYEGTVPPSYFRHAKAVIFVYSIDSQESIDNIMHWADSVSPQRLEFVGTHGGIIRVLVGNKSDLEDDRQVSTKRGRDTAENLEIDSFCEISAKTGDGFDELFKGIAEKFFKANSANGSAKETFPKEQPGHGKCRCGS